MKPEVNRNHIEKPCIYTAPPVFGKNIKLKTERLKATAPDRRCIILCVKAL